MSDKSNAGTDGNRPFRRDVLSVLGMGAVSSLAGCSTVKSFIDDQLAAQDQKNRPVSNSDEIRSDPFEELGATHQQYLEETEPLPNNTAFEYAPIDVTTEGQDGETVRIKAEPASEQSGDRFFIAPTSGRQPVQQWAQLMRAMVGAPIEDEVLTTETFSNQLTFRGGKGPIIATATSVGTIPNVGKAVLTVRGDSTETISRLAKTFEDIDISD